MNKEKHKNNISLLQTLIHEISPADMKRTRDRMKLAARLDQAFTGKRTV